TSCSSTCEARIGFDPTIATMRSTGRALARSPCASARRGAPAATASATSVSRAARTYDAACRLALSAGGVGAGPCAGFGPGPLRQVADEIRELRLVRRGDAVQVARVDRVQPARQLPHAERAPPVRGELASVIDRRADVLDRLAHQRRGAGLDLQVSLGRQALDV